MSGLEGHAIAAALVANALAFAVACRAKFRAGVVASVGIALPFVLVAQLACTATAEILLTSPPRGGHEAVQYAAWLLVYGFLGAIYAIVWIFLHGLPVPWLLAAWYCARVNGGAR